MWLNANGFIKRRGMVTEGARRKEEGGGRKAEGGRWKEGMRTAKPDRVLDFS
jgi:hypothetical protein